MTAPRETPSADLPPIVGNAHLQAAFLVELLLKGQPDDVRQVVQDMPGGDVYPLLGAALILAAEQMRDHLTTDGALERIAEIRQGVGIRS